MNNNYATKTELANALSHGIGILMTIVGTPLLILQIDPNNLTLRFGVGFYCFTLLMMFSSSTIYHAVTEPFIKKNLRIIDHISIFFLIGGSYMPFIILLTPANTAFWFLIVQWSLILAGITLKIFFTGQYRLLSSGIYIFMGCMVFLLGADFWHKIPSVSAYLVLAGGASYIGGVYFYQNQKIPYNHFIWHLFVLLAAILHYLSVFLMV